MLAESATKFGLTIRSVESARRAVLLVVPIGSTKNRIVTTMTTGIMTTTRRTNSMSLVTICDNCYANWQVDQLVYEEELEDM